MPHSSDWPESCRSWRRGRRVPTRGRPRPSGFTLAEMLMVLAVLGILSAVGYWQMLPALERAKVRRMASVMVADLQYAQSIAARQRQPVVVISSPSLKMYMIRDRAGTTVYRQRFVGEDTDYDVEAMSVDPGTSVEIFPNGMATNTTTFGFTIRDYEREVRLTTAGQVRILEPSGEKGKGKGK